MTSLIPFIINDRIFNHENAIIIIIIAYGKVFEHAQSLNQSL